jgi:hypothetical protein
LVAGIWLSIEHYRVRRDDLLSAQHGWSPVWLTFSAFAIALVAARLFLGHIPDTLGGAKVALVWKRPAWL